MSYAKISKKERDYLVLIFEMTKEFPVRVRDLAEATNVSEPTAYEYSLRLSQKGLVAMKKGMLKLTQRGSEVVAEIIKAHRVLETLFFKNGIDAEESCAECSKIDYLLDKKPLKSFTQSSGSLSVARTGGP
jgi:Mn-dependent transcriptional regulator